MEVNIICVKWGSKYSAQEVNTLYRAAQRYSRQPVRFFCLTDNAADVHNDIEIRHLRDDGIQKKIADSQPTLRRSQGALRKISVFNPELISDLRGPLLCIDIDLIITGAVNELFDYERGAVCMPAPFKSRPNIATKGEGSVIRFDPQQHHYLYEDMLHDTEAMLTFSQGSEQRYTSFSAHNRGALKHFPKHWVLSFLAHCRPSRPFNLWRPPALPEAAKIVCFPSEPKAHQAVRGYGKGLSKTLPAPWVAKFLD